MDKNKLYVLPKGTASAIRLHGLMKNGLCTNPERSYRLLVA